MLYASDSDNRLLDVVVYPDRVAESHHITDVLLGPSSAIVTKIWRTEGLLGRDGCGQVYFQVEDTEMHPKRALKVILTHGRNMTVADCQKELTIMVVFIET
jgi:hypothetical protein